MGKKELENELVSEDLAPPSNELAEEPTEAPVRPLEPEIEALAAKPVSGIVEPDSLATIRARRDAHLANLRR